MDLKAVRRGQFKVKTTELAERGGGGQGDEYKRNKESIHNLKS